MFCLITYFVINNNAYWYDDFIINLIRDITESKTIFYKLITFFGSPYFLISLTIILLVLLKKKLTSLYIFLNLVISFALNTILKLIFLRERPLDMLIDQKGYSFPSSHSFVALTFYGFLIYLIVNSKVKTKTKIIFTSLLSLLILLIGMSRIYLGVHYPTDVTAGFIGGAIYLIIFIEIINLKKGVAYEKEKSRKKEKKN